MSNQTPMPTAGNSPPKARLRLWLKLLKVSRAMEAEVRERLRVEFNTTLPRFDVMAALDRHRQGLKMSELSGVLRVSNGNVTGIVERLVQDGLVVRIPVEGDRRAIQVRLTETGQADFSRLAATHERWIDEILSGIDAEDADTLRSMLSRIDMTAQKSGVAAE